MGLTIGRILGFPVLLKGFGKKPSHRKEGAVIRSSKKVESIIVMGTLAIDWASPLLMD
jgi:hypothetical protein